ncbi:MAG: NDP-sugar synthase [Patescibacteria group bacterium]
MAEEISDIAATTVFILAAGLGTRLRPLTESVPKPMLPIAPGKPLLEHTICLLRDQGFRNFVLNLHHFPEKITSYFNDGSGLGVHIAYSDESEKPLGTAGAVRKATPLLSGDFILIYGDNVFFFDFRPLLRFHKEKKALVTIVLAQSGRPQDGDMAEVDPESKEIIAWYRRPHAIREYGKRFFWNAGLYVLSKKILGYIPPQKEVALDSEVLPALIREKKGVFGFMTREEILDMGTPEKYAHAAEWYKRNNKQLR